MRYSLHKLNRRTNQWEMIGLTRSLTCLDEWALWLLREAGVIEQGDVLRVVEEKDEVLVVISEIVVEQKKDLNSYFPIVNALGCLK